MEHPHEQIRTIPRNAEEAQRQADRATSDEIRAAWLQLVQGRLALCPSETYRRNKPSTFRSRRKGQRAQNGAIICPDCALLLMSGTYHGQRTWVTWADPFFAAGSRGNGIGRYSLAVAINSFLWLSSARPPAELPANTESIVGGCANGCRLRRDRSRSRPWWLASSNRLLLSSESACACRIRSSFDCQWPLGR